MADQRVVVVGAGLAGVLLAWRLQELGASVALVGTGALADATAASGGLVRAFEPEPAARALATASLAELLADATLCAESGFRPIGSLYLLDPVRPAPVGCHLLTATELRHQFGLVGLPAAVIGVWEPEAGHIEPDLLRRNILTRLRHTVATPAATLDGDVVVLRDGQRLAGDAVVLAAGSWTPALLIASGLPTPLRTKHIQYGWFSADATGLPAFVDETTGLYGRPAADGRVLLGLPSSRWDVGPDEPPPDDPLAASVLAVAEQRLPGLNAHPAGPLVSAADCYSDPPGLLLRPVAGAVHTFTGGSGGAAKTALAASRVAASTLMDQALLAPLPHG